MTITCVLVGCMLTVNSGAAANSPGRRPPCGQPSVNIHRQGRFQSLPPEEDAPRSRGIIRKSNMNPKNIGSCMEGKGEEGEAEGALSDGRAAKKRRRAPAGGRMDLMKN